MANNNEEHPTVPTEPLDLLVQGCERPWEVAVEPFQVAPHAYYVGNSWVGAYLLVTDKGLILIDATMHNQVYLVFESIRKLGFDPMNIKLLLLSHAHYDHCGGIRPILEHTGARLYMGKEDELFLKDRTDLIYTKGYPFGTFQADEYFDDRRPIAFGDMTINTLHTPGHTPGTTSLFFQDSDIQGNIYSCGMHGGIGLNTLDDQYFEESGLPASLRDDYLSGLLKMREMTIDITLGSHPGQTHMLEKAGRSIENLRVFVDKTAWSNLIEERIAAVKELMEKSSLPIPRQPNQ
jgi:metallo-beta-lactamase class B